MRFGKLSKEKRKVSLPPLSSYLPVAVELHRHTVDGDSLREPARIPRIEDGIVAGFLLRVGGVADDEVQHVGRLRGDGDGNQLHPVASPHDANRGEVIIGHVFDEADGLHRLVGVRQRHSEVAAQPERHPHLARLVGHLHHLDIRREQTREVESGVEAILKDGAHHLRARLAVEPARALLLRNVGDGPHDKDGIGGVAHG